LGSLLLSRGPEFSIIEKNSSDVFASFDVLGPLINLRGKRQLVGDISLAAFLLSF
jgi:hypothetical protein